MLKNRYLGFLLALMLLILAACGNSDTNHSAEKVKRTEPKAATEMILATTTSTQDSGLLDVLIPMFEKENNVKVKTIAVGTGQALEMGTKGEADVLLVHAPAAEKAVVDAGDAINYKRVMYNDFILVGPKENPAGVSGDDINAAFKKLSERQATFVSRGDDSGTHKKELGIWAAASIKPTGEWYVSTGQGMGQTLQVAAEKKGYVLTDRATWLAQEKNLDTLQIVVEGGKDLMNIYHVMQVNPEKHDKINSKDAEKFVEFVVDAKTQDVIEEFGKKEYGQSLFMRYTE
ncbi:substrate-binding domain-containing protein [Bacillus sp. ISL-40]|uniref:substrate-binding domain-containing protein n=1 Tax=unclassified Bacillus (in: firmicutes) TaxID=185979 RepID=UPI001BE68ACE|nr:MULTISPECIES: substrate-binding domain-containing protein [unclassified Bacillus (in: firmicutes)]MBT2698084.1 substrate-binding domain-containing protein [Bacillus sp. ISL-40]MBT2742094.1 substrate-binding domain-containing protein [Bacillus sp. ISL-77]